MSRVESCKELIARYCGGDDLAAESIHRRWIDRLIALARRRLGTIVAGREDPEDVIQSVYKSFFRRCRAGSYHLEDWSDVWSLLATIAVRKCANRRAFHAAGRRSPLREAPRGTPADLDADAGPSPEEAAILAETLEWLLRGLDPPEREIVVLALQGEAAAEIAGRVGRSERTVHRVLKHVRDQLEARGRAG